MKRIIKLFFIHLLILGCFSIGSAAQSLSKRKIDPYALKIDKLRKQKKLTRYFYPNKSTLGALTGYFLDGELVYFQAVAGGDQLEIHYFVYLKGRDVYKIVVRNYEYNEKRRAIPKGESEVIYFDTPGDGSALLEKVNEAIGDLNQERIPVK